MQIITMHQRMVLLRFTKVSRSLPQMFSSLSNTYCTIRNPTASTVDEGELAHFKKLSGGWWGESQSKGLHAMNQLRVPFIRDGLINTALVKPELVNTPKPLNGLTILDVGCGGGILSEALARLGGTIIGLDASSDLIEVAKKHACLDPALTNLTYEFSTIEKHVGDNIDKYDAIVSSEVLEHISDKKLFLEGCVKCLKPGGSIFITTINKTKVAWLAGIVIAEYVIRILPKGTHDWNKFIAPHKVQRILEDYNCSTRVVHGMWYNFLTNRWSWSSDNSVSYALQAVKIKIS